MDLLEAQIAIEELFVKADSSDRRVIDLTHKDNKFTLEISQQYEYIEFKDNMSFLQGMHKIAEILGCKDGDQVEKDSYPGCETCGYGGSYDLTWEFW